jgi:hypothetical protein
MQLTWSQQQQGKVGIETMYRHRGRYLPTYLPTYVPTYLPIAAKRPREDVKNLRRWIGHRRRKLSILQSLD